MKMSLEIRYLLETKILQDAPAKLCYNLSRFVLVNKNNAGPVCIAIYHPDKTDKIDHLIHVSSSKMAVKMNSVVKQLLYVLKLFRVTAGCIHSFRIRSKETFRIMYPKYPVLDMTQRIHFRCGSFGSIIRFSILVKKR